MLLHFHMTTFFTQVGTPDFKWRGWWKDFLGLKFLIPEWCHSASWMFLMKQKMFLGVLSLENSTWDTFFVGGGYFLVQGLFRFCWKPQVLCWLLIFSPIPSSPSNPEYPLLRTNCLTHPTEGIFCSMRTVRCPFSQKEPHPSHSAI